MSVFILKVIAVIAMTIDHLAETFYNSNPILRGLGRCAFLIYALLLAECFRYTHQDTDKFKRHLTKLIGLSLVSEFCYDFYEFGFNFHNYFFSQSNMLTLLFAFVGLYAIDKLQDCKYSAISIMILSASISYLSSSNYKLAGVLLIYYFYYYLCYISKHKLNYGGRLCLILLGIVIYIPIYHFARIDFIANSFYFDSLVYYSDWWIGHIFCAFILAAYNGKEGYKNKTLNKIYSAYYPLHLLIIAIIKLLIK